LRVAKHYQRDLSGGKILLIPEVLVGAQKHFVRGVLGLSDQFAVFQLMPANLPRVRDFVSGESTGNRLRCPLSNRTFIGERGSFRKAFYGEMQDGFYFFRSHVENFRDLTERHAGFEIFEDDGYRHPRTLQHPRSAHLAGNAFHSGTLRPVESCHIRTYFHRSPFSATASVVVSLTESPLRSITFAARH
jgi:hypothetical protein